MVLAIFVKLAGSAVQTQGDLFAGDKASFVDGFENQLDRCFMAGHVGRKTTLVTDGHAHALVVQNFLERMEYFGAITNRFTEAGCAHGDDHQLLQIKVVVGVRATVDHIHHGHGHLVGAHAAEITVQGQTRLFSSSAGHGHGDSQHRVGAQAGFVLGAVKVNQGFIQKGLFGGIKA